MIEMHRRYLLALQLGVLGILVLWDIILGQDAFQLFDVPRYEAVWWWDIVSHFLGGLWAASCIAWLADYRGVHLGFVACIASAVVVGIGWEIFEYFQGLQGSKYWSWQFEIVKDLFNDALGGLVAGYLVARRRRHLKRV